MDQRRLQGWWWTKQGLDGSLAKGTAAQVLDRSGWARSVGGVGPYLTLFSRAGLGRAEADRAAADLAIGELPAARGCTYVVPATDFALALAVGQFFGEAEIKTAKSLGVTTRELEKLCDGVLRAVGNATLDPDGIKAAVGGLVKNLGEPGKKKGLSTTLPVALGMLQAAGEIRRVPLNGRLDTQRFGYTRWSPNPLAKQRWAADEASVALARRFFGWVGPATLAEFRWFSGLGVKAAQAATDPLGLVPIEAGHPRLLLPDEVAAFKAFQPPGKPRYALVSSLDPISANRRDVVSLLDPTDLARKVLVERGLKPLGTVVDLPSHAILDRGRLIGLWEFDVESGTIVSATFGPRPKGLAAVLAQTESFVRDQLGDARSFSLDSPKSRAARIAALRSAKPT